MTGLPSDTDEDEVVGFCSKVGVLDLDPETQQSKVKLYRRREGDASGPVGCVMGVASFCLARPESVDLAMQIFDGSFFRSDCKDKVSVERAKFEQHGSKFVDRGKISNSKRKVAKLAALQAIGWDEGENGRITGGRKGLCIVVLKAMFDLIEFDSINQWSISRFDSMVSSVVCAFGAPLRRRPFSVILDSFWML